MRLGRYCFFVEVAMGTVERFGPFTHDEAKREVERFDAEVAKRSSRDWWCEEATGNDRPSGASRTRS